MKTITMILLLICCSNLWSQNNSGAGTSQGGVGGGPGISVTITSSSNSNIIEILPSVMDAQVVGYKIYNTSFELRRDVVIQPTNNQIIQVSDLPKGQYILHLLLDRPINSSAIIGRQFIKL